jgi:hypothetical protein
VKLRGSIQEFDGVKINPEFRDADLLQAYFI